MTTTICFGLGDFLIISGVIVGVVMLLIYIIMILSGRPPAPSGNLPSGYELAPRKARGL